MLVLGVGFLATGLTANFYVALVTFTVAGAGNGLLVVFERLLIQHSFPDSHVGRVFGIRDALDGMVVRDRLRGRRARWSARSARAR